LIKKISQFIIKRWRKLRAELRLFSRTSVLVSLGENCLTDAVLARHGVKAFTTPYSHGRSNLDYILQLEADHYADLLSVQYLIYEQVGTKTVVRNRYYLQCDPIYKPLHCKGFEFTHHDVIANLAHRKSYVRKIARLQKYKGKKHYIFFYHYRLCPNQDYKKLIEKMITLQKYYALGEKCCEINIFTQEIIYHKAQRTVHVTQYAPGIRLFVLRTLQPWEGNNDDHIWAKQDDDLLQIMLSSALQQGAIHIPSLNTEYRHLWYNPVQ